MVRRAKLLLQDPLPAFTLVAVAGHRQRAPAVSIVQSIKSRHQSASVNLGFVQVKFALLNPAVLDVQQMDAGLSHVQSWLKYVPHPAHRRGNNQRRIGSRAPERHHNASAVLLVLLSKGGGMNKCQDLTDLAVLASELFSGSAGEFAHRLDQVGQLRDRLADG